MHRESGPQTALSSPTSAPPRDADAIDEQTAIKVVDGCLEVASDGQWTKPGS
jgi:hypothetical protein